MKKKIDRQIERESNSHKKNIRVFGYKHPKSMKFMALLMKCLKDCME
jgi:hypothetical protein